LAEEILISGHCDERFAAVHRAFERNLAGGGECGAALAVTLDGESVVDLWGGYMDPAHQREWQQDTIANVYSTTKGMTAICAHQLVEQGRLDLDAPVAKYWPEFAEAGKDRLPVRYLLSHQAGLPAVSKTLNKGALYDWEAMTVALAEQKPWWEPGTQHGYHAITFGFLVGEVVRRVTGQTLGAYFREHVAEPLGLDFHIGLAARHDPRTAEIIQASPLPKRRGPGPPGGLADLAARMADLEAITGRTFNNPPVGRRAVNTRQWRAAEIPAANGHGTARALARVYGALSRGGEIDGIRVLRPESIERAIVEQAFGRDAVLAPIPMRFGLGFMLRHDLMPLGPNPRAFGHPGAGGSMGFADPDAHIGFGYVMNQMQMTLVGSAGAFSLIGALFDAISPSSRR
jgi:CubicO group peptidase (beta-lactamase class C family)